jgi:hypothetical protein
MLSLMEPLAQVIGLYTPFNSLFRHCRFVAAFFSSQTCFSLALSRVGL